MQALWEDYETGASSRRRLLQHRYGRGLFLKEMTDALSEGWIDTNTQECPKCSVKIHVSKTTLWGGGNRKDVNMLILTNMID